MWKPCSQGVDAIGIPTILEFAKKTWTELASVLEVRVCKVTTSKQSDNLEIKSQIKKLEMLT